MIFYLTYSEAPSGIYSSQVIDVVKFLNQNLKENIKLIAFVSLRNYFSYRKNIKNQLPNSIVLPMYPKMVNWKKNSFLLSLLCSVYKPKTLIARSVIACQLALIMRDKKRCSRVVYDGRGAIAAEWKEYNVVTDPILLSSICELEKEVVLKSDFRIAVSHALVCYWQKEFGYNFNKHVVIPCTLNSIFENKDFSEFDILNARRNLNLNQDDIVFVYCGSMAGWQSFDLLRSFISPILKKNIKHKLVFLSKSDINILELQNLYPQQVICKYLEPDQVPQYLIAADYGLLIREDSITNQVASPLKFAEYLACGLKVIISENLGDYSEFVTKNNCGYLYQNFLEINQLSFQNKLNTRELALSNFTKNNFISHYQTLIM